MDESGHRPTRVDFRGAEGIRLAAEQWVPGTARGCGTVLLLHGGGQTRHSWARTARRLAARGWTAITVDARGHGDSEWAPDRDYTLDAFVEDLNRIVSTCEQRPVLIGASLGGSTALVHEGERPGSIAGLVLVDVAHRMESTGRAKIREFMAGAPHGFGSLQEASDAVHAYNPHRPRPKSLEGLKKNLRQAADGRWYWHWDPDFLRFADEPARNATNDRLDEAARNVRVPTLLVRGSHSDVVTAEAAAEFLGLVPSARSVEVTAGHMVAGDDNDIFTAHLLDFLTAEVLQAESAPAGHRTRP